MSGVQVSYHPPFFCSGAVVQLVRIPACHAGGRGFESRPLRHKKLVKEKACSRKRVRHNTPLKRHRVISSVGRALPLQGRCQEFKSLITHHGAVVQLVRIPACHAGGRGFESRPLRQYLERGYFKYPLFILKFE